MPIGATSLKWAPGIGHFAWPPANGDEDERRGWQTEELQHRIQGEGVFEAIRGAATITGLMAKHSVDQTVTHPWMCQALAGTAGIFSGKAEAKAAEREREIEKLHARIGQLVVTWHLRNQGYCIRRKRIGG